MTELINVARLERRVQTLENSLSSALRIIEVQEKRLNLQLSRIVELELSRKGIGGQYDEL